MLVDELSPCTIVLIHNILVSKGTIVRVLARANLKVSMGPLGNREQSELRFHSSPDGAAVIPLSNGYVYVSNSEVTAGRKTFV